MALHVLKSLSAPRRDLPQVLPPVQRASLIIHGLDMATVASLEEEIYHPLRLRHGGTEERKRED
jgi:hypothetical protein